MTIEEITKQEHAFSQDGKTLYCADGNVYRVCYDYHDGNEITDFELISDYKNSRGAVTPQALDSQKNL